MGEVMQQPETDKANGAMTRALQGLKQLIINGELMPGEQVRQEEMAEQLRVSRVPLREAMNVLADQGLLFHRPHQGYFVTKRAPNEHAQIRRMLHLLENELMMTVRWPDADRLRELRELNDQMRQAVRQVDIRTPDRSEPPLPLRHLLALAQWPDPGRSAAPLVDGGTFDVDEIDRADDREKTLEEHDRLIAAMEARDRSRS